MSRLQLALNVDDIDAAVDFYTTLFDTEPAKRRPGYANFAIENPALKLVLFENPEQTGTLNHLGVERSRWRRSRPRPTGSRPPDSPWTSRATSCAATPARTSTGSPAPTGSSGRTTSCSPTPTPSSRDRPRSTPTRRALALRDDTVPANGGCCGGTHQADGRGGDAAEARAENGAVCCS